MTKEHLNDLLLDLIIQLVPGAFQRRDVEDAQSLKYDLGIDSLDQAAFMTGVEKMLAIEVDDKVVSSLMDDGWEGVVDYIYRLLPKS